MKVNRKFATYICCAIMALFAMNLTIISPLLTEISRTFSLGISRSGTLFTAEFTGFVAFILAGGVLADRWGKKTVLSISLAGFTATLFLFPLSPNFYTACIVMILLGGFGGVLESLVSALVADLNPINTSFHVNLSQVFFGIGALTGPAAAGILVSSGISWKVCYFALAAISLALTVIFAALKIANLPKAEKLTPADFKFVFTDVRFLLVCLCMILYTGSEVGGWGWMSTFLKKSMNFSIAKSSAAVAVFWTAMTIGRILCGQLTFRFSLKNLIMVLAFLSAGVTVLTGLVYNEAAIWVIIFAMGVAYSSLYPFIASYGSSHSRAPSGTVFALLVGSGGAGSMTVPYIMGILGEKIDLRVSMILPAVLLFILGLIFMTFKHTGPKRQQA